MRRFPAALVAAAAALVAAATLAWPQIAPGHGSTTPSPAAAGTPSASPSLTGTQTLQFNDVRQISGPSYGLVLREPTKDKEQTKLWYAGGRWWGVLLDRASRSTHIFGWTGAAWQDTGVVVDSRARSLADAVWTGRRLYIASRVSNARLILTRFRLTARRTWSPVDAAPPIIAFGGASTLSIDVDSKHRLWAVYNHLGAMWVTHSSPGGGVFAPARKLPAPNSVKADDTGAVVAVAGKIAVLWSDQVRGAFRFAIREDSDPTSVLRITTPPLSGLRIADGHIRLLGTPDGRIYAAVKTSLGDTSDDAPRSPLLVVLLRAPDGSWTEHVVATTADQMTRPQIVLSQDGHKLFFLASGPPPGSETPGSAPGETIYLKVADADRLIFAPGRGTPVLHTSAATINDATVARSRVSASTGILVLAADKFAARYYTARISLPAP
jgi:hypothetical protein